MDFIRGKEPRGLINLEAVTHIIPVKLPDSGKEGVVVYFVSGQSMTLYNEDAHAFVSYLKSKRPVTDISEWVHAGKLCRDCGHSFQFHQGERFPVTCSHPAPDDSDNIYCDCATFKAPSDD